jgi:hypothetical protein
MWPRSKVERLTAQRNHNGPPTDRPRYPRAILRLARGPDAPSGDSPPRSRPPQARDAAPTPPTRTLNALARHGCPGQKANTHHAGPLTPPGNHIPTLFRQPALCGHPWHVRELCRKACVNSVTLCRPLPYGLHAAPLERGRRNPRKRYGRLPRACAGQRRDIRPAKRVSSVTSGPVRPSLPLCYHPWHCSAIPDVVGARDDKTSPHPLLCVLRPLISCTLESAY